MGLNSLNYFMKIKANKAVQYANTLTNHIACKTLLKKLKACKLTAVSNYRRGRSYQREVVLLIVKKATRMKN